MPSTLLSTTEQQAGSKSYSANSMLRIVKIPSDESVPITEEKITLRSSSDDRSRGDVIPAYLQTASAVIDTTPLIRMTHPTTTGRKGAIVPSESLAGLYAYSISSTSQSVSSFPNIRATRLAMACGRHSHRFMGDVWIGRLGYLPGQKDGFALTNLDLSLSDIEVGSRYSPDLRSDIVDMIRQNEKVNCDIHVPEWLGNASQKNYHDGASLAALMVAMTRADGCSEEDESDEDDSSNCSSTTSSMDKNNEATNDNKTTKTKTAPMPLTEITLCLHCRGPASKLCEGCGGAYFCDEPRTCKTNGWSHQCLCSTWKIYIQRRSQLSSFPYFSGWQLPLLQEDCFTSEATYQGFLINVLGVMEPTQSASTTGVVTPTQKNWWTTELHGWSGGGSLSSKDVNPFHRVSYLDGFALKNTTWIPEERHVTKDDIDRANATYREGGDASNNNNVELIQTDEHGLPILTSWEHYYRLRSLPPSSPVGLLATFPLTLYYAIQHYGIVPVTVAQMLERPLRIHVVGIEKELNFVDLFKELGFLMPENVAIDMTWIVREDMFPENRDERHLSLQLTSNLRLSIVAGTYGESLNPDFDLGGPPDMIIGMNAGLFAYESWRHVISYLHHNKNIVGVFTDYNEHSGMNCASLGGWKSANSLKMNPFRQMRAMPVYCMNLPQFSNGFFYVFNEQELDE
mmetsp:Transcript_22183/g.39892  ORF Transcript_22183/g.39892 Transcript_22183/m.39892 type:complete len:683 (-) Transcript_22183:194-2242(-)